MSHRKSFASTLAIVGIAMSALVAPSFVTAAECPAYLNKDFQMLRSKETINICKAFAGKPLFIVNTASHCGFTPQFKELQALHEKYKDRGLVMIGFPSNDFRQESKEEAETAEVCYINYGVKFTMLAPSAVRGSDVNPVFKELARQKTAPSWNFYKYLVKPDGTVVDYYTSVTSPGSAKISKAIETVLAESKAK